MGVTPEQAIRELLRARPPGRTMQRGEVVDPGSARGPIRLRLSRGD